MKTEIEDVLTRRLLGLGQLGCLLQGRGGHIWIECVDTDYNLNEILNQKGILLNNKIYGGVLEALDTIDEALKIMGLRSLEEHYHEDWLFLGKHSVDSSRIDRTEKWKGGLV